MGQKLTQEKFIDLVRSNQLHLDGWSNADVFDWAIEKGLDKKWGVEVTHINAITNDKLLQDSKDEQAGFEFLDLLHYALPMEDMPAWLQQSYSHSIGGNLHSIHNSGKLPYEMQVDAYGQPVPLNIAEEILSTYTSFLWPSELITGAMGNYFGSKMGNFLAGRSFRKNFESTAKAKVLKHNSHLSDDVAESYAKLEFKKFRASSTLGGDYSMKFVGKGDEVTEELIYSWSNAPADVWRKFIYGGSGMAGTMGSIEFFRGSLQRAHEKGFERDKEGNVIAGSWKYDKGWKGVLQSVKGLSSEDWGKSVLHSTIHAVSAGTAVGIASMFKPAIATSTGFRKWAARAGMITTEGTIFALGGAQTADDILQGKLNAPTPGDVVHSIVTIGGLKTIGAGQRKVSEWWGKVKVQRSITKEDLERQIKSLEKIEKETDDPDVKEEARKQIKVNKKKLDNNKKKASADDIDSNTGEKFEGKELENFNTVETWIKNLVIIEDPSKGTIKFAKDTEPKKWKKILRKAFIEADNIIDYLQRKRNDAANDANKDGLTKEESDTLSHLKAFEKKFEALHKEAKKDTDIDDLVHRIQYHQNKGHISEKEVEKFYQKDKKKNILYKDGDPTGVPLVRENAIDNLIKKVDFLDKAHKKHSTNNINNSKVEEILESPEKIEDAWENVKTGAEHQSHKSDVKKLEKAKNDKGIGARVVDRIVALITKGELNPTNIKTISTLVSQMAKSGKFKNFSAWSTISKNEFRDWVVEKWGKDGMTSQTKNNYIQALRAVGAGDLATIIKSKSVVPENQPGSGKKSRQAQTIPYVTFFKGIAKNIGDIAAKAKVFGTLFMNTKKMSKIKNDKIIDIGGKKVSGAEVKVYQYLSGIFGHRGVIYKNLRLKDIVTDKSGNVIQVVLNEKRTTTGKDKHVYRYIINKEVGGALKYLYDKAVKDGKNADDLLFGKKGIGNQATRKSVFEKYISQNSKGLEGGNLTPHHVRHTLMTLATHLDGLGIKVKLGNKDVSPIEIVSSVALSHERADTKLTASDRNYDLRKGKSANAKKNIELHLAYLEFLHKAAKEVKKNKDFGTEEVIEQAALLQLFGADHSAGGKHANKGNSPKNRNKSLKLDEDGDASKDTNYNMSAVKSKIKGSKLNDKSFGELVDAAIKDALQGIEVGKKKKVLKDAKQIVENLLEVDQFKDLKLSKKEIKSLEEYVNSKIKGSESRSLREILENSKLKLTYSKASINKINKEVKAIAKKIKDSVPSVLHSIY